MSEVISFFLFTEFFSYVEKDWLFGVKVINLLLKKILKNPQFW